MGCYGDVEVMWGWYEEVMLGVMRMGRLCWVVWGGEVMYGGMGMGRLSWYGDVKVMWGGIRVGEVIVLWGSGSYLGCYGEGSLALTSMGGEIGCVGVSCVGILRCRDGGRVYRALCGCEGGILRC